MTRNGGSVDRGTGVSTLSDGSVFGGRDADAVQDTTAGELFRDLQDESGVDGPDATFGESADEIVADAEGHSYERFTDGGQAIAAGSELDDLLIPDREEGDEFHWVDPGDGDDAAEASPVADDSETTTAESTDAGPDGTGEAAATQGSGGILGAVRSLFGRR